MALVIVVTSRTWGLEAPGPEWSPGIFAQDDGFLFLMRMIFFFKVFVEFVTICFWFMFWFFGHEACGLLAP